LAEEIEREGGNARERTRESVRGRGHRESGLIYCRVATVDRQQDISGAPFCFWIRAL